MDRLRRYDGWVFGFVVRLVFAMIGLVLVILGMATFSDDIAALERLLIDQGEAIRTLVVIGGMTLVLGAAFWSWMWPKVQRRFGHPAAEPTPEAPSTGTQEGVTFDYRQTPKGTITVRARGMSGPEIAEAMSSATAATPPSAEVVTGATAQPDTSVGSADEPSP